MFKDKLYALRRHAGMSQQEVATAIGVTRQTIGNWELGQASPSLDKAALLARLYGVTLDDLVSDEVEVVSSGKAAGRDLHVLRSLVDSTCTVELESEVVSGAKILDVTDGWMRVRATTKKATFGKPRMETQDVVRLIDLADVRGVAVEGA